MRGPITDTELEAIYDEVPRVDCVRRCQAYCSGSIDLAATELRRIVRHLDEQLGAHAPLSRTIPIPDRCAVSIQPNAAGYCPLLSDDGSCRVYALRPLICRLWGGVSMLRCPWGCKAYPRMLSNREGFALMLRIGAHGGPPMSATEAETWLRSVPDAVWRAAAERIAAPRAPRSQ